MFTLFTEVINQVWSWYITLYTQTHSHTFKALEHLLYFSDPENAASCDLFEYLFKAKRCNPLMDDGMTRWTLQKFKKIPQLSNAHCINVRGWKVEDSSKRTKKQTNHNISNKCAFTEPLWGKECKRICLCGPLAKHEVDNVSLVTSHDDFAAMLHQ